MAPTLQMIYGKICISSLEDKPIGPPNGRHGFPRPASHRLENDIYHPIRVRVVIRRFSCFPRALLAVAFDRGLGGGKLEVRISQRRAEQHLEPILDRLGTLLRQELIVAIIASAAGVSVKVNVVLVE